MKKLRLFPFYLIVISLLVIGCDDNDDMNTTPELPVGEEGIELQNPDWEFIYPVMKNFYFWQPEVPALVDGRFANSDELNTFLNGFDSASDLFYNICLQHRRIVGSENAIDRFSFLIPNIREALQEQQGVFKTTGLYYQFLYLKSDSDQVVGIVKYVNEDTNAAGKNVERGNIFYEVDGETLFQNRTSGDNNLNKLGNETFELTFGSIDSNLNITETKKIAFEAEEANINPIFINKVLEVNGLKIGYLMYNRFTASYDDELNEAISQLKSQNIDELVLDLRYNPGGRVSSAQYLASMITGANQSGEVFVERTYSPIQDPRVPAQFKFDLFVDSYNQTNDDGSAGAENVALAKLELDRVYILTTGNSASASELVINGLNPYIDVIQIGTATTGKNEFSSTFIDYPAGNFQVPRDRIIPESVTNTLGIQPITGFSANSQGFFEYTNGLQPDIEINENQFPLGILGDINEPLLATAINQITGSTLKAPVKNKKSISDHIIFDSNKFTISKDNMYITSPFNME